MRKAAAMHGNPITNRQLAVWDVVAFSASGREKSEKKKQQQPRQPLLLLAKYIPCLVPVSRGNTKSRRFDRFKCQTDPLFFFEVSECVALCKQTKNGDLVLNIFIVFTLLVSYCLAQLCLSHSSMRFGSFTLSFGCVLEFRLFFFLLCDILDLHVLLYIDFFFLFVKC